MLPLHVQGSLLMMWLASYQTGFSPVKHHALTLVIIRLGDEVYNGVEANLGNDVLEFLHAIMYPHREEFLDTVKKYIDFSQNQELWQEVDKMSGLGMSILREGTTKGITIGEARGITIGEDKGVALSAEVFKAIQAGKQDNTVIAEQCGCTLEKVQKIRKEFGI